MPGSLILTTALLLGAAATSAWVTVYAWRRRSSPGAGYFMLMMAAVTVWSAAAVATHLASTLRVKVFWTNLQYLGIGLVPLSWLLFAVIYVGLGKRVKPSTMALLSLHPILLQIVVWTNPFHKLFRTEVWLETEGLIVTLGNRLGPAFWVHTIYSYGLLLFGFYLLFRFYLLARRLYRRQGVALMVALILPWAANVATLAGASPLFYLDLTPFAFALSGVAIAWGFLRQGLLDIVPVAQNAVMESLSSGIVVLDQRGRVVDVNPTAERILNRSAEELVGEVLAERMPEYHYLFERFKNVQGVRDEIVVHEGQDQRVYELRLSEFHDRRGATAGHLIHLQDITERKRSQVTMGRYAERLRILHEIDQAILTAQSAETIAMAALEKMHHLLPSQRASVVAFSDKTNPCVLAIRASGELSRETVWAEALERGDLDEDFVLLENALDPDPDTSPFVRRLYDEGVRAYMIVPLVVQDTIIGSLNLESTHQGAFSREHQDVALQIATSLAVALESARLYTAIQGELVERRAAETALRDSETTLRQKADDLTARNAELDAFAHSVAHDLKVPLSLLIGYTSYIEAGAVTDDPEQLALCIRAISQSARKMNSIIDELLLLASVRKVEEVDVKPLDMADIVSDVMVRFADVIEQKDVKISVPKVWPIASGYAPWIEEVWANYLSNAIKYGGTPPRLQLGASVLDGPSSTNGHTFVRFWVRDNGDGIAQAQQTRLFIPFERLDQVRVKGYGLGLSIVQRIMERLDGRAGVQSAGEPGQGSLFYFDLPQAKFL